VKSSALSPGPLAKALIDTKAAKRAININFVDIFSIIPPKISFN
jgi:hypothetical protein